MIAFPNRNLRLFENCAWLLVGSVAGLAFFLPWKWSILMDEASFIHTLTAYGSLGEGFQHLFKSYLGEGRLYPVKYLANLMEWRLLPLSPVLFHINHYFLYLATLLISWWAACGRYGHSVVRPGWAGLAFFLASSILAKPMLDMVQFLSIGEGWAAFFLAIGLFCLAKDQALLARLFWLLATGCKEPVAGVFACAFCYQLLGWRSLPGSKIKKLLFLLFDLALFLSLALVFSKVMRSGPYLEGYSLISLAGMKSWVYSVARLSFFMLPLMALALWSLIKFPSLLGDIVKSPRDRSWHAFLILFTLGYLLVVTARGTSGYLQIPAAWAALVLLVPFALKGVEGLGEKLSAVSVIALAAWMGFAVYSLSRWASHASGINDVSMVFRELIHTSHPRLLLVHGSEVRGILESEAIRSGLDQVLVKDASPAVMEEVRSFRGEVILLDPIRYFEPLPASLTDELGQMVGGWKHISAISPSYRAYYGFKEANGK